MVWKVLILAALLVVSRTAWGDPTEESVSAIASWNLTLDSNGTVTSLAIRPGRKTRINDVILAQLEKAIAGWKFAPGMLDGNPATTETTLHVGFTVSVSDETNRFEIVIDDVNTGGDVKQMRYPQFPGSTNFIAKVGQMENPMVVLEVAYDEQGETTSVIVHESSPVNTGPLVDAAVKSIRKWKFEPERVGGHGVVARVWQPVCFAARPDQRCSWTPPGSDASASSDHALFVDSQVRLKSDVVGKSI